MRSLGKRTSHQGVAKGTLFYHVLDSFKSKKIEEPLAIEVERIKELIGEFNKNRSFS